jgi:hypothetical protein
VKPCTQAILDGPQQAGQIGDPPLRIGRPDLPEELKLNFDQEKE